MGEILTAEFGLRGLFGVDVIVNADGVWPVEVNPRYTASLEILERAFHFPAIEWHHDACVRDQLPDEVASGLCRDDCRDTCGKAIVFADRRLRVESDWRSVLQSSTSNPFWPAVADIPDRGFIVERGRPIATVLAVGRDIDDVRRLLVARASRLRNECREVDAA